MCADSGGFLANEGGGWMMSAWAIVPAYPNELTPATSACSGAIPDRSRSDSSSVGKRTATPLTISSILGFKVFSSAFGGACSCCSTITALINPDNPAAGSRWPMLALTDPMSNGLITSRSAMTVATALISMGSPSGVPVP